MFCIGFLFIALIFLYFSIGNSDKNKIFKFLFIFICVYFAGLRDGLGQDYASYLEDMHERNFDFNLNLSILIYEPSFFILYVIIQNTSLSPYAYFLIMSILTIIPILLFFYKNENSYWSIFFFLTLSGFGYWQSFNLIRQFAAIALFCISLKYLYEEKYRYYYIFIFLSMLFHFSAILLFFLPLIKKIHFHNKTFPILIIVISFFTKYIGFTIPSWMAMGYERYEMLMDSDQQDNTSTIYLVLSILLIFTILLKDKVIKSEIRELFLKLGLLCILFCNLAWSSVLFMRFSLYFAPALFIALTYPIYYKKISIYYKSSIFIVFLFVRIYDLYQNQSIPQIVSTKILPLSIIFD